MRINLPVPGQKKLGIILGEPILKFMKEDVSVNIETDQTQESHCVIC